MNNKKIKTIPYGVANYELLVEQNNYYVDKTMYLPTVEKAGNYLFFIRPRRFGKSLFLAVMQAYYDVFYKDRFDEFFKGLWIHDHPTDERGKYLVLSLNFSAVEPAADKIGASFLNHVQNNAVDFVTRYREYLSAYRKMDYLSKKIEEGQSAADVLSSLLLLCKGARRKLYVIIDEYDNFANTILSTAGQDAYQDLTHGPGFFRSFFNALKEGTSGTGAPVTRSFITGVSPITMDDVTSGFNIGKTVFTEPGFNRILGFTRDDVIEMIEYYSSNGMIQHPTDYLLEIMTQWYGNYRFSSKDKTRVFNSDMILYFLDHYLTEKDLPDDLIDRNVRIDYRKLRHLIIVDSGIQKGKAPNGNFNRLKVIVEEGETSARIVKGFPLEELTETDNFISLLFYFGLLTVEEPSGDQVRLKIPNETMMRLYYDYIKKGYRETHIFDLDLWKYSNLMTAMAYEGKWEPLFDYIAGRMKESLSLRDLITGEKSIQAFLNVYLGLSDLYIVHVERELNKGYVDILLEPFIARYEGIKYSYLLEIKYIKTQEQEGRKPRNTQIKKLKADAKAQLKNYSLDKKFKKNMEKTTLTKILLLFSGHELLHIEKV